MTTHSCFHCGKNAYTSLDARPTCVSCFEELIHKKLRKHLSSCIELKANSNVLAIGQLAAALLPELVKGLPLQITTALTLPELTEAYDALFTQDTLDDYAQEVLRRFLFSKIQELSAPPTKVIALFLPLQDAEVAALAALRNIPFTPKPKDPVIAELLQKLTSINPSIPHNLLKGGTELSSLLKTLDKDINSQKS